MSDIQVIKPEYRPEWDTEEYWAGVELNEPPPAPVINTNRAAPFDPLGGVMWLEGRDEPVTHGPDEDGTPPTQTGGGTEPPAGEAV